MSSKHPTLLIFGATAPSRSCAASITTQCALYFRKHASVTLVISNHAYMPDNLPADIKAIRARDLYQGGETYKDAKRLYIFDDSHESLYALRFFRSAPGPWINADTTLHNLVKSEFRGKADWPDDYLHHMHQSLDEPGWHIGRSLAGSMRVSKQIASEIESFDAVSEQAYHVYPPIPAGLPFPTHSDKGQIARKRFAIVTIGDSCAAAAVETLNALGKDIDIKVLCGSEPDLADRISAADAVCILDKKYRLPPAALWLALGQGKAVATAGQPWVRLLPRNTRLNVPSSDALHYLVAAIGSLLGNSKVRPWLEKEAFQFFQSLNTESHHDKLATEILSADISPLDLSPTQQVYSATSLSQQTEIQETISLEGPTRPFALIGAVPPQALMEQLFPAIDWSGSPRFATPELADALSEATRKPASIALAMLGYESVVIAATRETREETVSAPTIITWGQIKSRLKTVDEALTFDCEIDGLTRVRSLTPKDTSIPGGLVMDFSYEIPGDIKRQPSSGYLERSGTYWHINREENHIECLIISGVPGNYKLSLTSQNTALIVADDYNTDIVDNQRSATIRTNQQGIMKFSIGMVDPVNYFPLSFEQLLEVLAVTPLNLEWCSDG